MTADSLLFDAGSLFFVAWIAMIAAVSLAAFAQESHPSNIPSDRTSEHQPPDVMRSTKSVVR